MKITTLTPAQQKELAALKAAAHTAQAAANKARSAYEAAAFAIIGTKPTIAMRPTLSDDGTFLVS